MRAPVRPPVRAPIAAPARRLACWLLFILFCYISAQWVSDHRLALSRLPSASSLAGLPAKIWNQQPFGGRAFSSSGFKPAESPNMDSQALKSLKEVLTREKLEALREFWFEHLTSEDDRVIPKPEQQRRWFFGGKEFDNICVSRFSPILEAIRSAGITSADQILSIAQPATPLDWLSLVILLDQIPRNSYRGSSASICFSYFDPLALQLATRAIDLGMPDSAPELRWQFAHRNWFYMPLMHSEDMAAHEKAAAEFGRMEEDVLSLLEGQGGEDEHERRARRVVQGDPKTAKALAKINAEFERKHLVIIERFGRYPHRNQALGREPTKEETEYLENGGDTFS